MLGIALQYGVELDILLAANPGVNPRLMSVGTELIIPEPEGAGLEDIPSATPVPFSLSEVDCYRTPTNGLWCVTAGRNGGT
ncbi:MAG: hypothetical protein GTO63_01135, partial [Anaerolineae bacterium]|nr:hypothetical protein [Anaerolineae bacterium]NIN93661.1 hypothetical protein [Anaerolineae bacterium]